MSDIKPSDKLMIAMKELEKELESMYEKHRMRNKIIIAMWSLLAVLFLCLCIRNALAMGERPQPSPPPAPPTASDMVDKQATIETQALYRNLKNQSGLLIGHQDTTVTGMSDTPNPLDFSRGWIDNGWYELSDVKSMTGSFPAMYSWEIAWDKISFSQHATLFFTLLRQHGYPPRMIDGTGDHYVYSMGKNRLRELMTNAYNRGGINSTVWHSGYDNFFCDSNKCLAKHELHTALPGRPNHHMLVSRLNELAAFFKSLKGANGELIPVIFRPYHEHTWPKAFAWGVGYPGSGPGFLTEAEYIDLWQFTVKHLRDTRQVHNLIYAISPDSGGWHLGGKTKDILATAYPGNDFVDIIGLDVYENHTLELLSHDLLDDLVELAQEKGKVAGITETGIKSADRPSNYYTDVFLPKFDGKKIAFAVFWRDEYMTYPGQLSSQNFIDFYSDPRTVFESNLTDMYK